MTAQLLVSGLLALAGLALLGAAVVAERQMQRHRQPGVSYAQVTLRRDGGWRRADLFSPAGLRYQRCASQRAVAGSVLLVAGLLAWMGLGAR